MTNFCVNVSYNQLVNLFSILYSRFPPLITDQNITISDKMSSQNMKMKVPCTFCPRHFAKSYIKKHMKTHTDELKSKEAPNAAKSSEEEMFVNDLEAEEDDAELYNAAEQFSVISSVIKDILDDAMGGQKTQIDPSPSWFMNTMSGLEGLLEEACCEGDNLNIETLTGAELIECDGYTCGECGKNVPLKEEIKKHLNDIHGHHISLQNTPSVAELKSGEEALLKKVELYEEAIKNLTNTKEKIIKEKHTLKEDKDKEIKALENDRDKFYRLNEKAKDSYYRLQGLNANRIHTVIENKELRKVADDNTNALQETLKHNQVLDDSVKVRDLQIITLEDLLAKTKEECEKRVKEAEDTIEEKNSMIRHLEEDLGVWESVEPQLTAANEVLDTREREMKLSQDAHEDTLSVFKCQQCNFSTENATILKGHMTGHNKYKCDHCQEDLKYKNDLSNHTQREHRPDIKKCPNCAFRANDATRMKNHMERHKTYKCHQCEKVTANKSDLNNHINNEHRSGVHVCNKCQRTFTAQNALKQHINSQHPTNTPVGHPQWAEERNQTQVCDYSCNIRMPTGSKTRPTR